MPYHVEISSSPLRHARAFNLDAEQLLSSVVEPWLDERPIELGDHEWLPGESALRILEGPELAPADLSFGQGWSNAERRSRDVTRRVLEESPPPRHPDAFLLDADPDEALPPPWPAEGRSRPIPWKEARRMIEERDPEVAAVIVVRRRRPPAGPPRS